MIGSHSDVSPAHGGCICLLFPKEAIGSQLLLLPVTCPSPSSLRSPGYPLPTTAFVAFVVDFEAEILGSGGAYPLTYSFARPSVPPHTATFPEGKYPLPNKASVTGHQSRSNWFGGWDLNPKALQPECSASTASATTPKVLSSTILGTRNFNPRPDFHRYLRASRPALSIP